MSVNTKESARILLSQIVDYAGLFPPSQLSMSEAVGNYASYRNSRHEWMLGRFVVPVTRLDEFTASAKDFLQGDTANRWRLSVLASGDIVETVQRIQDFNAEFGNQAVCDAIEAEADSAAFIEEAVEIVPPEIQTFFELSLKNDLVETITTLAIHGQSAKIRTGGVTVEAFPPIREIIRFIRVSVAANVPFKATAGLHHPLRCYKPLTYETGAPEGMMNGFLNLFLATGFVRANLKPHVLEEIMEDKFEDNFEFTDEGVWWRREHFLSNAQLKAVRTRNIISFGSCSFEEPVEDLQEIGLL